MLFRSRNSLRLADERHLASIAFPAISTGVYGYPLEQAAEVTLRTITAFLADHPDRHVRVVLLGGGTLNVFRRVWQRLEA